METRMLDEAPTPIKESLTALNVAQAYYLSTKYHSSFRNDLHHRLIHYLVASAKHAYPKESKWIAEIYDTIPVPIGKCIYSIFNIKNYPGHIASRKDYISKSVENAIDEGALQVLVIGGGFDVLAIMKARKYPFVQFFEIDRGPHREIKQQALANLANNEFPTKKIRELAKGLEILGKLGNNLHFVDADLTIDWEEKLLKQEFDPTKKTICIAEGLTMYLTKEEVCAWLSIMKQLLTNDSTLILSFIDKPNKSLSEKIGNHLLSTTDEAYKMRLTFSDVQAFMLEQGFSMIETLHYKDIQKSLGLKTSELSAVKNLQENYFKVAPEKPTPLLEYPFDQIDQRKLSKMN